MLNEMKNLSSRSACAENPGAHPGAGGKAGGGRKGAPCIVGFQAGSTVTLLNQQGPGIVRHIWRTVPPGNQIHLRNLILRIYKDPIYLNESLKVTIQQIGYGSGIKAAG